MNGTFECIFTFFSIWALNSKNLQKWAPFVCIGIQKRQKKLNCGKVDGPRFKGKMLEQSNLRIYFCNIPVTKTKEAKTSQVNSFCVCIHL